MNNHDLNEICGRDRFGFMLRTNMKIAFSKKGNLDLLAKMIMMLSQSFGKPTACPCLFVDEVRNRSMFSNLHNTIEHCDQEFRVINFREKKSDYPHAKVGYIRPALLLSAACISHLFLYLAYPVLKFEKFNQASRAVLIAIYQNYLKRLHGLNEKVYCMTDHNFYSTITCVDEQFESYVLQHGLVLDKNYYSPVLADHFRAWGERSREMMDNDPKVQVTGTYKFEKLKPSPSNNEKPKKLLYCVSIVDQEVVGDKISALLDALKGTEDILKVKMHPGSFYSCTEFEKRFANQNLEFYKECDVADIKFDIAVIENSTILLDMICLDKPFIIFDEKTGYFSKYSEIIPWAECDDQLHAAIVKAQESDFTAMNAEIRRNELNDGRCSIWN